MIINIAIFNDYSEGAHPNILEGSYRELILIQETGYGEDSLSLEAASLIKEKMGSPNVDVHFVSGGTQHTWLFWCFDEAIRISDCGQYWSHKRSWGRSHRIYGSQNNIVNSLDGK